MPFFKGNTGVTGHLVGNLYPRGSGNKIICTVFKLLRLFQNFKNYRKCQEREADSKTQEIMATIP